MIVVRSSYYWPQRLHQRTLPFPSCSCPCLENPRSCTFASSSGPLCSCQASLSLVSAVQTLLLVGNGGARTHHVKVAKTTRCHAILHGHHHLHLVKTTRKVHPCKGRVHAVEPRCAGEARIWGFLASLGFLLVGTLDLLGPFAGFLGCVRLDDFARRLLLFLLMR